MEMIIETLKVNFDMEFHSNQNLYKIDYHCFESREWPHIEIKFRPLKLPHQWYGQELSKNV